MDLNLKNVDFYAWFSEKSGPRPKNVDLLRMIFWKKVDLNLNNVDLYTWLSEKSGPQPEHVDLLGMIFSIKGTWAADLLCMIFWKNVNLNLKMWTFTHDFLKKVDLELKKSGLFTHDFLRNSDLDLKMCTSYEWFYEKSGPRPENVDVLQMIFWKKWTSTWKCEPFMHDFLKKMGPQPKKVWTFAHDFLKKVDIDLKMWTF